jgi:hypothetical protein
MAASFYVPTLDRRVVCVVDRTNTSLAAVISSHCAEPGRYFPVFTFPGIECENNNQKQYDSDEFIGQMVGSEAAVKLGNALASIKSSEYIVLAGLSEAQKSYLNLSSELKTVDVGTTDYVREALGNIGIRKAATVRCRTDEIHEGLHYALNHGAAIEIDESAEDCSRNDRDASGLVLIERARDNAASIIAVNYAASINASIKVVAPVDRKDQRRLLSLLQAWKDNDDDAARNALFAEIDARLTLEEVKNYEFVTFFTDGVPYTVRLAIPGVCSYVNLSNSADHFIINNILAETEPQMPSAVVFTIDEFEANGEARSVANRLERDHFTVRTLAGVGATGFSFGYHAEHFPYGVFHIVSHGGEIDGYAVVEEFTDRNGCKHVVEYDEVVGIHRVLTESDLFSVQRKVIFKSIDGFDWGGDVQTSGTIPHYVYEDMRKHLFSKQNWGKGSRRVPKASVPGSCAVKCNGGIHQAMFRTVGGYGTPLIVNNTCWSSWGVADFFIGGGARAYLGTLWAVNDPVAVLAAGVFYDAALGGNIAMGVREVGYAIAGTDNADIYALWGLHFSTLSGGQSLKQSIREVCGRLAMLLKIYGRFLETAAPADDARDNAIEAIELLDQDFGAMCDGTAVASLRARVAQTLAKVGPKQRSGRRYSK